MSIYVKNNNSLEQAQPLARECPHCGAHAQLIPFATPSFDALSKTRPLHAGMVFRCAACDEPRFLRAATRRFEADRIELSSHFTEIERPRERFKFGYLPPKVGKLFREALDCYTADCHNAFGSMCRRTVQQSLKESLRNGQPHLYDLFRDAVRIGELDATTVETLEALLFTTEIPEPEIDEEIAAQLIEISKDMLYQCFVRTAKLRAALKMRRYFAEESAKVTRIDQHNRRAETA